MSLTDARQLIEFVRRAQAAQKAVNEMTRKEIEDKKGKLDAAFDQCITAVKAVDPLLRHIDIWLTQDEYDAMTLMCGYATAAAKQQDDKPPQAPLERALARSFLHITNRLHEGNPNWNPYAVKCPRCHGTQVFKDMVCYVCDGNGEVKA